MPRLSLDNTSDDIRGLPWKHMVTISGYENNRFWIIDPAEYKDTHEYSVDEDVLLDSIIRYDNNMLVIWK